MAISLSLSRRDWLTVPRDELFEFVVEQARLIYRTLDQRFELVIEQVRLIGRTLDQRFELVAEQARLVTDAGDGLVAPFC
jgi:hypothetical protein